MEAEIKKKVRPDYGMAHVARDIEFSGMPDPGARNPPNAKTLASA